MNINDRLDNLEKFIQQEKQHILNLEAERQRARDLLDIDLERMRNSEIINEKQSLLNILLKEQLDLISEGNDLRDDQKLMISELRNDLLQLRNNEREIEKSLNNQVDSRRKTLGLVREIGSVIKATFNYLMQQDKKIKRCNRILK